MDKVTLVVMDKEKEKALEELRNLGIVHLEKKNVQSEKLSKLLEKKTRLDNALGLLRPYAEALKKQKKSAAVPKEEGPALIDKLLALGEEKKSLQEQLLFQAKERTRLAKWGDFEGAALKELEEAGVRLVPYELSAQSYAKLGDTKVIVLGREKTSVRLLALETEIPGETPFVLPERSLSGINRYTAEMQNRLAGIERDFASLAGATPLIDGEAKKLLEGIEFESARSGMDVLEAEEGAPPDFAERTVSWLSGYVPREKVGVLKRGAAEYGWALISDEPGLDDQVPTLLKNNKLVSLIYPLTNFLETVPGYREVDISGWFLLFFCIFFGMIFGDAGYGFILALIAILGILKTSKKGVPAALKMMLLLSISNIAWGVATCTWFGADTAILPDILRRIAVPLVSGAVANQSAEAKALVDQNLQIFCFSLALLQLGIAHLKGIIRNIRSPKFLSELGSLAMLVGMYNVVLFLVVSNNYRQIPFLPPSIYLIAGGFLLTFIFANYDGSIGRSIMESLKNIISVILGITNVFSDIMSYIRLWAVGLAGAAISSTVNQMASPLLGNFLIFLGILLLFFGHGLNVILNMLSVVVHGVRLNTLEFSGHLGLTWSGMAYKPFKKG
jgi:V/A-type H+-transporting ATPase subunit I